MGTLQREFIAVLQRTQIASSRRISLSASIGTNVTRGVHATVKNPTLVQHKVIQATSNEAAVISLLEVLSVPSHKLPPHKA